VIQELDGFDAIDGRRYKHWAYYCLADGPGNGRAAEYSTRLACANDPQGPWEFFTSRPDGGEVLKGRWPSVYCDIDNRKFYMFYGAPTNDYELLMASSSDGLNWSIPKLIIPHKPSEGIDGGNNTFLLWHNPDRSFYLFYHDNPSGVHRIIYRRVRADDTVVRTDDTALADMYHLDRMESSDGVVVLEDPAVIAAPSVFYHDGTFWLLVETYDNGIWRTAVYRTSSLTEGRRGYVAEQPRQVSGSLLGDHAPCAMPFRLGNHIHVYYAYLAYPGDELWEIRQRRGSLT
jgi:hypothetical protein